LKRLNLAAFSAGVAPYNPVELDEIKRSDAALTIMRIEYSGLF
jgi:hypothetical protein